MRKFLFIFTFTFAVCVFFQCIEAGSAWDVETAKYFPLQVGNKWVYRGTSTGYTAFGRSYQTYTVTGVKDTLGRRYYEIEVRVFMITGTLSSGVMQFDRFIRIDSSSMNLFKLQTYCSRNEWLIDSLRAGKNDSLKICPFEFYTANSVCTDTSNHNLFGTSYPSKRFSEFFGPGYNTVYVKGIGIAYSSYGYQMNQTHDTIRGCIINGIIYGDTNVLVGINQLSSEVPKLFSLSQNYPNPFNPVTHFGFQIAESGLVKLTVYDALGKEVEILVNRQLQSGSYEADWDASTFPSGVYCYKLESGSFTETKKMVLLK
ncbi:MAG TPA: T9SS type A sorting domain-containing protein [Ignavibacteria bacterium]|mgnify:CR=1 FL=1|nr:T9SS type A sorting domain-containing protein [Ignavibacteria bacterium]HMQ98941.1 T9SS type A sorting domain-containing protein [Ignavibacteria bacterium]